MLPAKLFMRATGIKNFGTADFGPDFWTFLHTITLKLLSIYINNVVSS